MSLSSNPEVRVAELEQQLAAARALLEVQQAGPSSSRPLPSYPGSSVTQAQDRAVEERMRDLEDAVIRLRDMDMHAAPPTYDGRAPSPFSEPVNGKTRLDTVGRRLTIGDSDIATPVISKS
jgi:hypothetical protein